MTVELFRALAYVSGQLLVLITVIGVQATFIVNIVRSEARMSRWSREGLSASDLERVHPLVFDAVTGMSNRPDAARLADGLTIAWPRLSRAHRTIPWVLALCATSLALTHASTRLTATGLTFAGLTILIAFAAFAAGLWVGLACTIVYEQVACRISPLRGAGIAVGRALELHPVPPGESRYLRRSSRAKATDRVIEAFEHAELPVAELRERRRHSLEDFGWVEFQETATRTVARAYDGDFIGHGPVASTQHRHQQWFKLAGTAVLTLGTLAVAVERLREMLFVFVSR
jgi:hypothetical protein